MGQLRLIARIALFSALVYILAYATAFLPNISLMFFVVFAAGFLWGALPGLLVGLIGMGLFSIFNPSGPAPAPITLSQMIGAALCGLTGAAYARSSWRTTPPLLRTLVLGFLGIVCTALYFVPVSIADAWVFQPFWPRLLGGLTFNLISVAANAIIFPLLFLPLVRLYDREHRVT
jgi:uncharacterized membrane protein